MYADCGTLMPEVAEVAEAACGQCMRRMRTRKSPGRPPRSQKKPTDRKSNPMQIPQPSSTSPKKVPLSSFFYFYLLLIFDFEHRKRPRSASGYHRIPRTRPAMCCSKTSVYASTGLS